MRKIEMTSVFNNFHFMRTIWASVTKIWAVGKTFIYFAFYFYRVNIIAAFDDVFVCVFYDVTTFVLESNADKWLERVKGTKMFSTKHSSATFIIYTYI